MFVSGNKQCKNGSGNQPRYKIVEREEVYYMIKMSGNREKTKQKKQCKMLWLSTPVDKI